MNVKYCDLCGQPIKDGEVWKMYLAEPEKKQELKGFFDYFGQEQSYYDTIERIRKSTKEICHACKEIVDKIFEYRKENLHKLTEECHHLLNLPPFEKKPKTKKKNK